MNSKRSKSLCKGTAASRNCTDISPHILPFIAKCRKKTRLVLKKKHGTTREPFPIVSPKHILSYNKKPQDKMELIPDRWASNGWKYRMDDIRKCAYLNHPNKVNFFGKTSYQFLSFQNPNHRRHDSTYKLDYNPTKQKASKLYHGRSFSNVKERPNSRNIDKMITESSNVASTIYGSKFPVQDLSGDSYSVWSGKFVYNNAKTFHKKRSDFHEWIEKAVCFGLL